ncbi:hypothetical protein [Nocardiopsis sp. CNR-923]|uniref:hypothetical protein n=1 Tax=Nocardiopsis sp. CNR-923 TaxID=1904965 RepID=UPI002915FB48|nr:hypothetical protein [Nocardiopsis sp. CNR-923]
MSAPDREDAVQTVWLTLNQHLPRLRAPERSAPGCAGSPTTSARDSAATPPGRAPSTRSPSRGCRSPTPPIWNRSTWSGNESRDSTARSATWTPRTASWP